MCVESGLIHLIVLQSLTGWLVWSAWANYEWCINHRRYYSQSSVCTWVVGFIFARKRIFQRLIHSSLWQFSFAGTNNIDNCEKLVNSMMSSINLTGYGRNSTKYFDALAIAKRPLFVLAMTLLAIAFSSTWSTRVFAQNENTADLTIEVMAEFVPKRGTKYKVTRYADEQCGKHGKTDRLLEKRSVAGRHVFKTLTLDASENFIFQVRFEQKKLRQLKSCASIANLTLQPGHEYKVVYEIIGEVLGCSMKIYDLTATEPVTPAGSDNTLGEQETEGAVVAETTPEVTEPTPGEPVEVAYNEPELSCLKIGKAGFKNNVPVHSALELSF